MKKSIEQARELFEKYQLKDALNIVDEILVEKPNNIEALILKGKVEGRMQNYGNALNSFGEVLRIDKDNSQATIGIKMIRNILKITNNYYYENAYTDDSLYEFED